MSDEEKVVSLSHARSKEKKFDEKKMEEQPQEAVHCSFCGRPNHLVIKMIKGPGVNICSECVMICIQYFMLEDRIPSSEVQKVLDSFWRGVKK
ncbi:MAG TPA: ClpX C4-type zinc finger protein [Candidatus Gastranaerophilales bacterium]|nr:ClpX C4-type zinc finger protein [Candidatus Gastranaerophilales bacterium]